MRSARLFEFVEISGKPGQTGGSVVAPLTAGQGVATPCGVQGAEPLARVELLKLYINLVLNIVVFLEPFFVTSFWKFWQF